MPHKDLAARKACQARWRANNQARIKRVHQEWMRDPANRQKKLDAAKRFHENHPHYSRDYKRRRRLLAKEAG